LSAPGGSARDYATQNLHCHVEKFVNITHPRAVNLLLIEDEVDVADLLARAFREEGHLTSVAHSGEDGLARLGRERPDAVLLDIRLPKMNGIEVLRRIREIDQALPVIIITGLATPSEISQAWDLGVTEVIEKSYVLKNLSESLALAVRKRPPA
jgi:DNA-binding response OmpR family regulator